MEVKNLLHELQKVDEGTFIDVLPFNNTQLGAVDISGTSPIWEMHPDTDELFFVIEGRLEIELIGEQFSGRVKVGPNETMVVPIGHWHKISAPEGAKFMYLTPGESVCSEQENPLEELS